MTNDATDEASRWAWIAPDGVLASGDEWDLVGALRAGELPPNTLVWRRTWVSWLPAARVAELAPALPPAAVEAPEEAAISPTALTPPARPRAALPATSEVRPPPLLFSPRDRAGKPSFGVSGRPRGPSILGPAREADGGARPSLPTLGADEPLMQRATTTLRPPGAIPPPPRTAPAVVLPRLAPPDPSHIAPTQRRPQRDTLPGTGTDSSPPLPPFAGDPTANPEEVSAANLTLEASEPALPPSTIPGERASRPAAFVPASDSLPPRRSSLPVPRSMVFGLVGLAGITALLAGGMVALVLSRTQPEKRPVPAPSVARSPEPAPAPKEPGCRVVQPAARLATSVHRPVPPLLSPAAEERVAIGLAETPKQAAGLIVNLSTLDAEHAFEQSGDKALFGTVPFTNGTATSFVVDRAGGPIGGARTVAPGLVIGTAGGDFVRSARQGTTPLWRGAAREKTTDPRVASTPSGHLVTFRRGGLSGRVLYGWLDPSGKPDGELVSVRAANVSLAGTPDAAARADEGLLVFAGRPHADADWRVQLVTAPRRGTPSVKTFATPASVANKGSIAPSATPLAGGGWVLQWTEGSTGEYQVHLQRLNAQLEPLGEARLVSPKGANSGQGNLLAIGSRVLSVFVQTTAGHDELWGASFECP